MIARAATVMIWLASSVHASAADERVRTFAYDPDQIVKVAGRPGIQSTIEFRSDERIENIAIGNSSAWQVTPNRRGSVIFLKPLQAETRTNMTVVTDHRVYLFDLVPAGKDATPVYVMRFSYPLSEEQPQSIEVQQKAVPPKAEPSVAVAETAPEQLYFDWKERGAKSLRPARAFDDQRSLFIAWNRGRPLPAILTRTQDDQEAPLNYRVSGDYIVVTPVPQNVIVRYDNRSAQIWRSDPLVLQTAVPSIAVEAPQNPAPSASQTQAVASVGQTVVGANETAQGSPPRTIAPANAMALLDDSLAGAHK